VNDSTASPRAAQRSTIWPSLALLGLILLAFALRVYRLPAQSLWYDEGVSWYLTRMSPLDLTAWTADDIQPPLYYYLLWPWVRLAGTSEYALRFLSVAFGTLTVPLLWVTGRWLLGERAAWLGALILTLSPLHVYYAQEARMYTLLTFMGLLSSYLLLRWLEARSPSLRSPYVWAYVLTVVAALYTHYFAFFLLAAHALYVLYLWLRQLRSDRPLKPGIPTSIAISISILILYLPWLPFLATRYGVDTSYWPGALKAGEVARKLFIAFSLGETVPEQVGTWLAIGYGLILLVSIIVLLRSTLYAVRSTQHESRIAYCVLRKEYFVFLLLYLLVPMALVLLLAQRTPKFNPRYAMLASPAFILLFAGGLSCLIKSRITHHASRFTFYASRIIAAAALILILTTSIYSLNNWYQPYPVNQFNKADFRITAQIVANRISPDETVLLSSGHMFPAWAYYYGWEGWERLPDIEILDVAAALDLSAGDELDRLLQGKDGTWLARWQNEVTDPFDVLPLYLSRVGTQDDYGQFWQMELFHYSLPPDARFDLESFITQPAEADFGGQAQLLGMSQVSGTELILFWQALSAMETNYTIFVHLLDADGETLVNADHQPPRPTREWRPGQAIPDRVSLALSPDLPTGEYWIEIGLYDADDPALSRLPLGDGSGDRVIMPIGIPAGDLTVEGDDLE
jgi:mannosyltransferase